ncbi:hypothetical protein BST22_13790 [Mycolicibacterium chubuense]|uniref:Uncharacterized protein n=1 Tax=Mycolicibacterium chubuense TaxID=1800 RepID=A0A0J6ZH33_MYCCU|nr:hypothetical protein [Mycolicibacterium chubuense]KMO84136.1 hypothetical protein MCHUDSM44219_00941 [Mycolicibacterium chubuense]ORA51978.1 hypothetical protein BST22_13790 [Mycolicibacterium chubuense]SPX99840.1 Uncharacterised protein [Mycolicibacterium chubuense]
MIRVGLAAGFLFGDDAILLAMDSEGITAFKNTVSDALREGASHLDGDGVAHDFVVDADASCVELSDGRVVWRFDRTTAGEVVDHLSALASHDHPGHSYVDITSPVDTLVLSRDEYAG